MKSAAVLFVKNEYQDIIWWISWYLAIGFDHIYVFDDHSDDGTRRIVELLSRNLPITFKNSISGPAFNIRQKKTYIHAIQTMKGKYDWAGFFDADEYLVLSEDIQVNDLIFRYRDAGAIGINWCCYGSNQHIQKPDTPNVFESYTNFSNTNLPENNIVKSLVNISRCAEAYINPHHFPVDGDYLRPDGSKLEWDDKFDDRTRDTPDWRVAKVRHHIHRSVEHYVEKIKKRSDLRSQRLGVNLFVYHDTNENTDFLRDYQYERLINKLYDVQSTLRNHFFNFDANQIEFPYRQEAKPLVGRLSISHHGTVLARSATGALVHSDSTRLAEGDVVYCVLLDRASGRALLVNQNLQPLYVYGEQHCSTIYPIVLQDEGDGKYCMKSTTTDKIFCALPSGPIEGGRIKADAWEHVEFKEVEAFDSQSIEIILSKISEFLDGGVCGSHENMKKETVSDLLVSLICLGGAAFSNRAFSPRAQGHYLPWLSAVPRPGD